jgi:hypothetical protein
MSAVFGLTVVLEALLIMNDLKSASLSMELTISRRLCDPKISVRITPKWPGRDLLAGMIGSLERIDYQAIAENKLLVQLSYIVVRNQNA